MIKILSILQWFYRTSIAIIVSYEWFQWIPILGMGVAEVRLLNGYTNIIDTGAVAYGGEPSYGFAATLYHVSFMVLIISIISIVKGY